MRQTTQKQIILNKNDILDFISSKVWDGEYEAISAVQDNENLGIEGIRWDETGDEIIIDVC